MVRRWIIALGAVCALGATAAFAASEAEKPPEQHFSFEGPLGNYDMGAVQRGFAVYRQVCANCHSMNHLSYDDLAQPGAPFAAYRVRDEKTHEESVRIGLPRDEHGRPMHGAYVSINDNPYLASIAHSVQIADIDPDTGQPTERPGRISDHFRKPFPNDAAARASNGGALPPDLSEIVLARIGGSNYVHALMTGYTGEQSNGKYVNRFFPGHLISMPPPLADGVVTYDDGTPNTLDQEARDVAQFLQWAADPHMVERKSLGVKVLIFLLVLTGLLYLTYKQVWRDVKH
ncbi:MAG TPA: cytochrome c1 [Caulobacterales bacterium]|nr:cytochrome c1 [Caulobacterales bacterium]